MYYYDRDVEEIDVYTRPVVSGFITDGNGTPREAIIPGQTAYTGFYVEDVSGVENTLQIKKSSDGAPTLTIEKSSDGINWSSMGTTSTTAITATIPANGKIYLRCNASAWGLFNISYYYNQITCTRQYNVGGNIMSLLYGSYYTGNETSFPANSTYNFLYLFQNSLYLRSASNLILQPTSLTEGCYYGMFIGCYYMTSASFSLPATVLADSCYYSLFQGCSALTTIPNSLPATTLANSCYKSMFQNCTSLTSVSFSLPATVLADYCYSAMFLGCRALTTIPNSLPATTLTTGCYNNMFGSTAITTPPTISATTLETRCFQGMFNGCTYLTSTPSLNYETLKTYCYMNMFTDCTGLLTAPSLPATTLQTYCYYQMFKGCTGLTSTPSLNATTLKSNCYYQMFYGCSSLSTVTCNATSISASNATTDWLYGVAATGTFNRNENTNWSTGTSGIPSGWSIVPPVPVQTKDYFYIKNLASSTNTITIRHQSSSAPNLTVYYSSDQNTWSSITVSTTTGSNFTIPSNGTMYLRCSATAWDCNVITSSANMEVGGNLLSLLYSDSFEGKTSFPTGSTSTFRYLFMSASYLKNADNLTLPVTTAVHQCCCEMFYNCTGLTSVNTKLLSSITTLATNCYLELFYNCTSLTTTPELPATTLVNTCYGSMFYNCSKIGSIKVKFTSWNFSNTKNWTYGCKSSGTFYKPSSLAATKNKSGNKTTGTGSGYCNSIPYNWGTSTW